MLPLLEEVLTAALRQERGATPASAAHFPSKELNKRAACDEVFHVAYVSELKFLKFPAVALLKTSAGIACA